MQVIVFDWQCRSSTLRHDPVPTSTQANIYGRHCSGVLPHTIGNGTVQNNDMLPPNVHLLWSVVTRSGR